VRPSILWNLVLTSLALASLALAQQGSRDKSSKAPSPQQKQEPATQSNQKQDSQPLFKNKLGYQSSKGTKESTTLAFNGVDPSGKVERRCWRKPPAQQIRRRSRKWTQAGPPLLS
jgi:hypothetical protein